MDAACVTSLLLTSSTAPRHAAMPDNRSSARRRRTMRSGVTAWIITDVVPSSGPHVVSGFQPDLQVRLKADTTIENQGGHYERPTTVRRYRSASQIGRASCRERV